MIAVQLQQVILNLIVNAADAMRGVERRLLKIETSRKPSGMVRVSIEDTGPGIRDADRDRIFEPLFTTKASGMGMGLSICRSIIENHGGTIWVARGSREGHDFLLRIADRRANRFTRRTGGLTTPPLAVVNPTKEGRLAQNKGMRILKPQSPALQVPSARLTPEL